MTWEIEEMLGSGPNYRGRDGEWADELLRLGNNLIDMGEQVIVMIETSLFLSEIHVGMEEPCLDSPQIDLSLLWCLFLSKDLRLASIQDASLILKS